MVKFSIKNLVLVVVSKPMKEKRKLCLTTVHFKWIFHFIGCNSKKAFTSQLWEMFKSYFHSNSNVNKRNIKPADKCDWIRNANVFWISMEIYFSLFFHSVSKSSKFGMRPSTMTNLMKLSKLFDIFQHLEQCFDQFYHQSTSVCIDIGFWLFSIFSPTRDQSMLVHWTWIYDKKWLWIFLDIETHLHIQLIEWATERQVEISIPQHQTQ